MKRAIKKLNLKNHVMKHTPVKAIVKQVCVPTSAQNLKKKANAAKKLVQWQKQQEALMCGVADFEEEIEDVSAPVEKSKVQIKYAETTQGKIADNICNCTHSSMSKGLCYWNSADYC